MEREWLNTQENRLSVFSLKKFFKFISNFLEHVRIGAGLGGGSKGRGRENPRQAPRPVRNPTQGLIPPP